jgi:hypothetical protein
VVYGGSAETHGRDARLSRLVFFGPHGEVCFVELKRRGSGRLSEAHEIAVHLWRSP